MMAGWGGLFAVNVLASDLKLQAAVSRASQGRQESIICTIHPEWALWGWGSWAMGSHRFFRLVLYNPSTNCLSW